MKIAEELYQAGFISYPRTETDSFSASIDLMVLASDCLWFPWCPSAGNRGSTWLVLLALILCSTQSGFASLTISLPCC